MSAIGTKLASSVRRVERRTAVERNTSSMEPLLWALIIGIPLLIAVEIQWVAAMVAQ